MRTLLFTLILSLWQQGCCGAQHTEPAYPKDALGWRDYEEGTTKFRGSFVLKKGESTDNGKIKIKVIDLLAPKCTGDAGDFSARARVKLLFCKQTDEAVLYSDIFPESGGGNVYVPDEFGIFGVGVRGINLKEGWVFFVLTGDY